MEARESGSVLSIGASHPHCAPVANRRNRVQTHASRDPELKADASVHVQVPYEEVRLDAMADGCDALRL